jgi:PAS domain S-box-containing protein
VVRSALDAAPIPTIILRDARVAYANEAFLEILRTTREAFLGTPYTAFVAPDELERVADRQARRLRGEHSPSVYLSSLVWGGERRSVQVHAAAVGGDIVVQFLDVTDEAVHRTRLSEVAQLGVLVQRELREEDVRRTVLQALPRLELEGILFRPDGDRLRVEAAQLDPGRTARFEATFGEPMVGSRQPWIPALRQAWKDGAIFMDDWLAEARRLAPGQLSPVDAEDASLRSAAAVRIDVGGQPDALLVAIGRWLRAGDLPAFWLFGSQVSAALDAARSIQLFSRRNEELSLLNQENARLCEDLRRSYADLARAQDQLVRQERLAALGELAAVVAHEVRNPLGAIFNSLVRLRRLVRPSGDAKMLFDIVAEEADHLNRIVGELLEFAKPSPPTLRPEPLDRVLDEAVAAALARTGDRVTLVRDVPDGLPLIPMDARLVRQAVLNVALNAVQAMPEGGTLSVSARLEGETAMIELSDTGPGIPAEVRQRIFEPFFTTKATGTGLGLAVVKRILDDHRGRVEVRAPATGGTVFTLQLPLISAGSRSA